METKNFYLDIYNKQTCGTTINYISALDNNKN